MATPSNILIFPEQIFESSDGRGQSDILLSETEGDEYRLRLSHRRRVVTLKGGSISNWKHEEFQTFLDLAEDEWKPFLYLDLRRFRLQHEPLGTGDGATRTFQLTRTRTFQNRTVTTPVYFPDHDYPPRFIPCSPSATPIQHWPRPGEDGKLHVFANGVEVPIDVSTQAKLDALRYGGTVELVDAPAAGATLTASGCFYHLMRLDGNSPDSTPLGGGQWQIGTINLIEPKNLMAEIAALREAI